jgi:hypothetical protein
MSNQAAQALPGSALSMMSQFHDVHVPVEKMLPSAVHNSFDRQYRETFTARIKSHPAQSHRYFARANFVCMQFDMTNILPASAFHELAGMLSETVSVGEVHQWFQDHPTVESCFPGVSDTKMMDKITRFMGWLALYLEDDHYNRNQTINGLASFQMCSNAIAWLWINTDYVSDAEMIDLIEGGANEFHDKAGFCFVYHPHIYKQIMAVIEPRIVASFRHVQLHRVEAQLLSNPEVVPPAELPPPNDQLSFDSTDDETIDGNITGDS